MNERSPVPAAALRAASAARASTGSVAAATAGGGRRRSARAAVSLASPARLVAVLVAASTLAATAAPSAAGLGRLPNGRFDGSIAPFAIDDPNYGIELAFDPDVDRGGGAGSGSLRLVDDIADLDVQATASGCLSRAVPAGDHYFSFDFRFAGGETASGWVSVAVHAFPTPDCTGLPTASFDSGIVYASEDRGEWVRHREGDIAHAADAIAPGTGSLLVQVELDRVSKSGALTVHLDNLFLAPVGRPRCNGLAPTIGGTDAADVIRGTSGPDVIVGLDGDDAILAGDGDDVVCAGRGADDVWGEEGDDRLSGQGGADTLFGGVDQDVLKGGAGNDFLSGWHGFDSCLGGAGTGDAALSCENVAGVP